MESYAFAKCQSAIAGNHEAVQVLRDKGYRGSITVIPQFGVDPIAFSPSECRPKHEAPFQIGFVGRLVKEKGAEFLVQALADVPGDWKLHIVGSGPMYRHISALVAELGLESHVNIQSWRPSTEMPSFLNSIDLLVVPSQTQRNWKEQFGRVLIEAMACGIPVVGSSCGEIPNVIGEAGLVFPEGDAQALRELVNGLMQDHDKCIHLGNLGRERVMQHFTQEKVAADTCRFYRDAVSPSPALRSEAMRI
jgi:glycosyltransferase involved in cell wall biosynthesis